MNKYEYMIKTAAVLDESMERLAAKTEEEKRMYRQEKREIDNQQHKQNVGAGLVTSSLYGLSRGAKIKDHNNAAAAGEKGWFGRAKKAKGFGMRGVVGTLAAGGVGHAASNMAGTGSRRRERQRAKDDIRVYQQQKENQFQ